LNLLRYNSEQEDDCSAGMKPVESLFLIGPVFSFRHLIVGSSIIHKKIYSRTAMIRPLGLI